METKMIQNKYGEFSQEQFNEFKERLHAMCHHMLIYAEQSPELLPNYFTKLQAKLNGLNSLLNYNQEIVNMMALVESARLEFEQYHKKTDLYRKFALEVHEAIDHLYV